MTDNNGIHSGSLQFYPRVRAKKVIPSVNWKPLKKGDTNLLGFIGYKVGMTSVWAKDDTPDSLTKGKRVIVPATILECPAMRIYSVRFYKGNKVLKDVLVSNDKRLKKKVKLQKKVEEFKAPEEFDDLTALMFTDVKNTTVDKNKADLLEIGLSGDKDSKLEFVKEKIGKDILIGEVFSEGLVDIRAVTKGFGTQGPVKRFGIAYKDHKSEKGQKRPGSLAPWHPSRVTFRAPQMGQTGYQNRIAYNNLILKVGKISEEDVNKKGGFEHYGIIKNDYIILKGSVPGPKKRGVVITQNLRSNKYREKKKYEVFGLR